MIKETRTIHYGAELAIEAYWLQNVLEPFLIIPDYYLIGFIEECAGTDLRRTEIHHHRRRPVHPQPPRAARLPLL